MRSASSSHNDSPSSSGSVSEDCYLDPMGNVMVSLPPLLLAAVLRNLTAPGSSSTAELSFSNMIPKLSECWRVREFDDIGALTLRLQLFRHSLQRTSLELQELFSPLTSTELGSVVVALPSSGFSPKVKAYRHVHT